MKNSYPENLTIEIDREGRCKYHRIVWASLFLSTLSTLGALFAFTFAGDQLVPAQHTPITMAMHLGKWAAGGILAGATLACVLYLFAIHRQTAREARNAQVLIEGAFLRLVSSNGKKIDRKLHFRSIIDYSVEESSLMRRLGIKALTMNTQATGINAVIRVVGIKNCDRVRDMLAEIDSQREI